MQESDLTDDQLVEQARRGPAGDPRAFETLVTRHQAMVLANCRYLSGSPADVDDLAQEVFTKAYFALKRFEGRSKFSTWIRRIKVNHVLNFLAKRRGKEFVDVEDPVLAQRPGMSTPPEAPRELERQDQQARITAVLDTMSETLRVPLILRDADGMSYQEIADDLGVGLSAVKMRIKRAREEFRQAYGERGAS